MGIRPVFGAFYLRHPGRFTKQLGTKGIAVSGDRRTRSFILLALMPMQVFLETLLGPEDAVISDELNHAASSTAFGSAKPADTAYKNNDMTDLEARLNEAQDARFRLVATDGSFSMDGIVADLKGICDLADRYEALVMVDDSHSTGFIGTTGRGTPEYHGVMDRVDIITSTFGKSTRWGLRRVYQWAQGNHCYAPAAPHVLISSPTPWLPESPRLYLRHWKP